MSWVLHVDNPVGRRLLLINQLPHHNHCRTFPSDLDEICLACIPPVMAQLSHCQELIGSFGLCRLP